MAHPVLSQPGRSPIPMGTFPPPALRTRRADFRHRALQWNHAARTRVPGRGQRAGLASRGTWPAPLRRPAGVSSGLLTPWRQRPLRSSPLLVHVMTSGIPAHLRGTRPSVTPASLLPFAIASTCGPFPPPALPGFLGTADLSATLPGQPDPRGLSVGACHATGRASRVVSNPLFHTCHRQYPGGTGRCSRRSLPDRWQPSPFLRRVGFRSARFEALLGVYSRCGLYGR